MFVGRARHALDDVLTGLLAVDQRGHLLERRARRLHEQEVHDQQLHEEPHVVHDVVLPLDGRDRDGVGVLVEDERAGHEEVVEHEPAGSEVVRQDLHDIGHLERRPSDVERERVEEYHGQHALGEMGAPLAAGVDLLLVC